MNFSIGAVALILALGGRSAWAALPANTPAASEPATQPANNGAISPEMVEALRQLSAQDFQTRQQAVGKLQQAMTTHFQQMILVQELMLKIQDNLAQQLKEMTLSADPGSQARVASLMEFNQALSRWAIDVLALPAEKREAMLQWGLSPEGYPLVVRAYSRKPEVRAAVAKDLAKISNDSTAWLLGQLLDDLEREVSLCTMDAVWDKTPTAQMIDVLWGKAVGSVMQQFRQRPARARTVNVHGRMVQIYDQEVNLAYKLQDADVAADVLIHWKSPVVTERLNSMFQELAGSIRDQNDYRWRVISPNYGEGGKTLARLVENYKPKEAYGFLLKILSSASTSIQDGYVNQMNNLNYWQSTRVDAAVLLALITSQDPEDYKLQRLANYGDRWMLRVTAKQGDNAAALKEEGQMIREMLIWWRDHHQQFGVEEVPAIPREETSATPAGGGRGRGRGQPVPPANPAE